MASTVFVSLFYNEYDKYTVTTKVKKCRMQPLAGGVILPGYTDKKYFHIKQIEHSHEWTFYFIFCSGGLQTNYSPIPYLRHCLV